MNLLMKMREIKDLSPAERHVVEYILDHWQDMTSTGIIELAQKTYTSTSTVKRLCKKLGVDSYIDFRLELSVEMSNYLNHSIIKYAKEPVDRMDSMEDIVNKVSNQNAKSILDTSGVNPIENYKKVVDLMNKTNRIDFYGLGPSNVVAKDAQIKCMRLGLSTSAYGNIIEMMINARASNADRLAFLISYTGETKDIIEIAEELQLRKVPTISMTSMDENTLGKLCDVNLFVQASESWNRLGGMSSRLSTLSLFDILFTAYINSDYEVRTEIARQTYVGRAHQPSSLNKK